MPAHDSRQAAVPSASRWRRNGYLASRRSPSALIPRWIALTARASLSATTGLRVAFPAEMFTPISVAPLRRVTGERTKVSRAWRGQIVYRARAGAGPGAWVAALLQQLGR